MIEPKDPKIKEQAESNSAAPLIYSNIYQNKAINALMQTSTRNYTRNILTGDFATVKDGVSITFSDLKEFRLEAPTLQVFVYLVSTATRQITHEETRVEVLDHQRVINIPVADYMTARGLKDRKGAIEQLRREIPTLRALSLEWQDPPNKKGTKRQHSVPFFGAVVTEENPRDPVKYGRIKVSIDIDMAKELAKMPVMPYPPDMLRINTHKNPHAWYLIFKLCALHNMNYGKKNANVVSIQTLINSCPNLKEVQEQDPNRNNAKIRTALERDLNAITDGGKQPRLLKEWYYIADGEPLTDKQLQDYSVKEWINLSIHYELLDYPNQAARIETAKKGATRTKKQAAKPKQKEDRGTTTPPAHDTDIPPPEIVLPCAADKKRAGSKKTPSQ